MNIVANFSQIALLSTLSVRFHEFLKSEVKISLASKWLTNNCNMLSPTDACDGNSSAQAFAVAVAVAVTVAVAVDRL